MARFYYCGYTRDGNGNILSSATVTVYTAGTTTAATVYAASSGGSSVGYVTSDSDGFFEMYVDETEYYQSQKFKFVISKTGYTSKTLDNVRIFPGLPVTIVTSLPADTAGSDGDVVIYESGSNHCWVWKAGGKWYKAAGTAVT